MTHWGGTGDYAEGERVFAPPHGSFDPDWVAGIVLDREGLSTVERTSVAGAAESDWAERCGGASTQARIEALQADGFAPTTARAVVGAVEDFAAAYHLDD